MYNVREHCVNVSVFVRVMNSQEMSRIYATTLLTVQAEIRDVQKDVSLSGLVILVLESNFFLRSKRVTNSLYVCHTKKTYLTRNRFGLGRNSWLGFLIASD